VNVRSFADLPCLPVREACVACIKRIAEADEHRANAALDAEIAKRARGWPFGLLKERWTRDDARRYFNSFTGIDACFNPLLRFKSDQRITAERLLALADAAILSGAATLHVTADDFDHISSFYRRSQGAA